MENFDKEVLRKNRLRLAKELDLEELLQILVTNGILSDHQVEKILCKSTRFNKNVSDTCKLSANGLSFYGQACLKNSGSMYCKCLQSVFVLLRYFGHQSL